VSFTTRPIRILAALSPIAGLVFLYAALQLALATSSLSWACLAIGVAFVVLAGAGTWLSRAWMLPLTIRRAMWITLLLVLVIWAWQRVAFVTLVPGRLLTYGFFLTPEGRHPRLMILEGPLWIGGISSVVAVMISCFASWKSGHRVLPISLATWWLAVYLTLATPSLYLWAQGDAGIFI
jgi:hypothetical protein